MALSRKEQEELQPMILEVVTQRLGFPEKAVIKASLSCIAQKLDRDQTIDQLSSLLGQDLAPRFVEDLFGKIDRFMKNKFSDGIGRGGAREKRSIHDVFGDDNEGNIDGLQKKKHKSQRLDALIDDAPLPPTVPEPLDPSAFVDPSQVNAMVANMKKQIEERKKQIALQMELGLASFGSNQRNVADASQQQYFINDAADKAKKAADLQAKIQARLSKKPDLLSGANASTDLPGAIDVSAFTKPTAVVLDDQGRTVDPVTGRAIQFAHRQPTLKVNIREKKREHMKIEKPNQDFKQSAYFDPRVGESSNQRSRKAFRFHDAGKFQKIGQRLRAKAQLEKLQKQIQSIAKKTGISSAAKLALATPKKESESDIPLVEWWDLALLPNQTYDDLTRQIAENESVLSGITNLVEHPPQKEPPAEPKQAPPLQIFLTKKERKKIRMQRRKGEEKEKQEKIRLGLIPPPPPKVKISNLMRVLASEAVQDPTKVEAHVRAQMAQRQKAHEQSNAERKLSPGERKAKKIKKLTEDTDLAVHVAIYRLKDLSDPAKKFKVDANAQQYYMTGAAVVLKTMSLVIVEGGPKAQKKFKRLMLHRIKWEEDEVDKKRKKHRKNKDDGPVLMNKCSLVWEGTNQDRNFENWTFKQFANESEAREFLRKKGVEQYWDLSLSQSLLEESEESTH
eukprot:gene18835-20731_t